VVVKEAKAKARDLENVYSKSTIYKEFWRTGNYVVSLECLMKSDVIHSSSCVCVLVKIIDEIYSSVACRQNTICKRVNWKYCTVVIYPSFYESHCILEFLNTDTIPTGMRVGSTMVNVPNLLKISSAYKAVFHIE